MYMYFNTINGYSVTYKVVLFQHRAPFVEQAEKFDLQSPVEFWFIQNVLILTKLCLTSFLPRGTLPAPPTGRLCCKVLSKYFSWHFLLSIFWVNTWVRTDLSTQHCGHWLFFDSQFCSRECLRCSPGVASSLLSSPNTEQHAKYNNSIIPNLQIRYLSKHSAISEGDIDVPAVIRNHIQFSPLCREMFGWYWNIAMW